MFSCSVCSSEDPTTDTVRVSFPPTVEAQPKRDESLQLKEKQLREQQEKEDCQEEAEAREAEERHRAAVAVAEARRKEAEAFQAQRIAEEKKRKAEEEARKLELQRDELEKKRLEEEELKRQEDERLAKEAAEAQKKVDAFLKKNGFKGPATKKLSLFSSSLPIHTAVKLNDADLVRLLLARGADPAAKISGQTAQDLAKKEDKRGSHAAVIAALSGSSSVSGFGGA